jgi:hypothetical protein
MIETRGQPSFGQEHPARRLVFFRFGPQTFENDELPKPRCAVRKRQKDVAHSAATNPSEQFVFAELSQDWHRVVGRSESIEPNRNHWLSAAAFHFIVTAFATYPQGASIYSIVDVAIACAPFARISSSQVVAWPTRFSSVL